MGRLGACRNYLVEFAGARLVFLRQTERFLAR